MNKQYIPEQLIQRYAAGECTEEEMAIVESWHLHDLASSDYCPSQAQISIVSKRMGELLSIHTGYHTSQQKNIRIWPLIAFTACLLFTIVTAAFLYFSKTSHPLQKDITHDEIIAGSSKAMLTLGSGKKIILAAHSQGLMAKEANTRILTDARGTITYAHTETPQAVMVQNRIETPRGGQYQVTLSDGTHVWLNAASSLSFPVQFNNKERNVQLSGEAYFEVSKDVKRPFKVITQNHTVKVLGTHFNVYAYPDEAIYKTTLLEGQVDIISRNVHRQLLPGQEGQVSENGGHIVVTQADLDKSVAWKNNEFMFNGEDLQSILKLVARWYDVEIIYPDAGDSNTKYSGIISRTKSINSVLKMLKATGKVNFKIQGRRITVMY